MIRLKNWLEVLTLLLILAEIKVLIWASVFYLPKIQYFPIIYIYIYFLLFVILNSFSRGKQDLTISKFSSCNARVFFSDSAFFFFFQKKKMGLTLLRCWPLMERQKIKKGWLKKYRKNKCEWKDSKTYYQNVLHSLCNYWKRV